jgi:serine/threonine protein kinase
MTTQSDLLVGQEIDGYVIEKLLGEGGMARVYRAHEIRLGRYVAIKVIEPQSRTDVEYTRRFEKEARAVSQLQHPHIVNLYRFGETGGLYYMAMQYVEGVDLGWVLADYVRDQALMPHEDVLRTVSQIGAALDYAHGKGVIHRDIKPQNIMLDKDGRAILTDFGLVLVQSEGTRGEIFGTPDYIAPEQAVSSAGAVPESDQYSLGITLYQMLTGSLPYEGKSAMDIAMAHMTEPLPSPLERNPDLHPSVVRVVERVLQKEAAQRYPTCSALAGDLHEAFKAQTRQPSTIKRVSMLTVSEQVKVYRSANPLPPLPAAVNPVIESADPKIQVQTPATQPIPKPPNTLRHPSPRRQTWLLVMLASAIVIVSGTLAIVGLMTGRGNVQQTIELTPVNTLIPTELNDTLAASPTSVQAQPTSPVVASQELYWDIQLLANGDETLYVINSSGDSLPPFVLAPLTLRGEKVGEISGNSWPIDTLQSGECVRLERNQRAIAPVTTCTQVGGSPRFDGAALFWKDKKKSFTVQYTDQWEAICQNSQVQAEGCQFEITLDTPNGN